MIGVVTLTGVGFKFSYIITVRGAGDRRRAVEAWLPFGMADMQSLTLFAALVMTGLVCILMGCGIPTTANYIIMVTVAAPTLVQLGVQPLVAHFFVFYYGVLADITPPVALAAYAAAGMAGSDPFKTGNTAFRLGLGKALVPFVFVFSPSLLSGAGLHLDGVRVAFVGCLLGITFLGAALSAYLLAPMPLGSASGSLSRPCRRWPPARATGCWHCARAPGIRLPSGAISETGTCGLKGKVCVVTAAGQGIGAATARAFASEGATVWATDVDAGKLSALNGVDGIQHRASSTSSTRRRSAPWPRRPARSTCCSTARASSITARCSTPPTSNGASPSTSTSAACSGRSRPSCRAWSEKGGGSIVNMSSAASSVKGAALRFIYGTTKAAVIGLTKSVAVDYVGKGMRCNAICPGTVQTPSLDERIAALGGGPDARKFFLQRQPTGRFGSADEIAALAVYLASDEAAFTTGTVNVIDGGWSV